MDNNLLWFKQLNACWGLLFAKFSLKKRYNYIIQGAGASGLWLAYWMHKEGLLDDKTLLIVECDKSKHNDRTWCFWGDALVQDLGFVDFSWSQVQVFGESQRIDPYTYYHCRSEAFYTFVKNAIGSSGHIDWCFGRVAATRQIGSQVSVDIQIDNNTGFENLNVAAEWFFGSGGASVKTSEIALWQSFAGWRVKSNTGESIFDSDACTLMDFGIEQRGKTQFLYVLPFSGQEALIEVTQFDKEILGLEEGQRLLQEICEMRGWDVSIIEVECNAIPMSSVFDASERFHAADKRIVPLGVVAGALKPTTGYGFLRMMQHGKSIAAALKCNELIPTLYRKRRFRFYDDLLLRILQKHPNRGKQIFDQLFQHQSASNVLRFLNEKTNILQEIMIFSRLPKRLFLRTLFVKWKG
jgi:lycopene beta-cyclase